MSGGGVDSIKDKNVALTFGATPETVVAIEKFVPKGVKGFFKTKVLPRLTKALPYLTVGSITLGSCAVGALYKAHKIIASQGKELTEMAGELASTKNALNIFRGKANKQEGEIINLSDSVLTLNDSLKVCNDSIKALNVEDIPFVYDKDGRLKFPIDSVINDDTVYVMDRQWDSPLVTTYGGQYTDHTYIVDLIDRKTGQKVQELNCPSDNYVSVHIRKDQKECSKNADVYHSSPFHLPNEITITDPRFNNAKLYSEGKMVIPGTLKRERFPQKK